MKNFRILFKLHVKCTHQTYQTTIITFVLRFTLEKSSNLFKCKSKVPIPINNFRSDVPILPSDLFRHKSNLLYQMYHVPPIKGINTDIITFVPIFLIRIQANNYGKLSDPFKSNVLYQMYLSNCKGNNIDQ